jgi:hypothetical protein
VKIRIFFILLLIFLNNGFASINNQLINKSLIIISDYADLSDGTGKILKKISFGESVNLNKVTKEKLNISFKNKNFWIDADKTNYISSKWTLAQQIELLDIYIPDNLKFTYYKDIEKKSNDIVQYLHKETFMVEIFLSNIPEEKNLKEYKKSLNGIENVEFKRIFFNGQWVNYYSSYMMSNRKKYYMLIFSKNEKQTYQITVMIENPNPTIEEEITARKILFSVRKEEKSNSIIKSASKKQSLIAGNFINIRNSPYKQALVLLQLNDGDKVYMIGKSDHQDEIGGEKNYWYKIEFQKDGKTIQGWVYGKFIKVLEEK